jgi:Domain of unknown function (DUF4173)
MAKIILNPVRRPRQNILLVIASMFRLDLYAGAFSLTYLRLAAFIWTGLVAAGLLLILIQIMQRKPISWLLTANAATLAIPLADAPPS